MTTSNPGGSSDDTATDTAWHRTIYYEASCQPDDVLYQGSEDEDYDQPKARRQKYEAAGQRYLSGHVPLLLSATLRGPFNKESGWSNPWRSKNRTSAPRQACALPSLFPEPRQRLNQPLPHTTPEDTDSPESLDCHLPSPESLKQARHTVKPPFLDRNEVAPVQRWIGAVTSGAARETGICVDSRLGDLSRKRKFCTLSCSGDCAAKKRKVEQIYDHGPKGSLGSSSRAIALVCCESDSNGITQTSKISSQLDETEEIVRETDREDELGAPQAISIRDTSVESLIRVSPKRKFGQATGHCSNHSDDELSPAKRAVAFASSPGCRSSATHRETLIAEPGAQSQLDTTTHLSSPLSDVGTRRLGHFDSEDTDSQPEASSEDDSDPETQQDKSFAFKFLRPSRHGGTAAIRKPSFKVLHDDKPKSAQIPASPDHVDGQSGCHDSSECRSGQAQNQACRIAATLQGPETSTRNHDGSASSLASVAANHSSADQAEYRDRLPTTGDTETVRARHQEPGPERVLLPISENIGMAASAPLETSIIGSQISLVQRPASQREETEGQENHPDASQAQELESTRGSECTPLLPSQSMISQERKFPDFSLRSILNSCVSPLRRLSGLSVHPESAAQSRSSEPTSSYSEGSGSSLHIETNEGTEAELPRHDSETAEDAGNEPSPQSLVENTRQCTESQDVPANLPGSSTQHTHTNPPVIPQTPTIVTSFSQQSPWFVARSSQKHDAAGNPFAMLTQDMTQTVPTEAQSPWVRNTENLPIPKGQELDSCEKSGTCATPTTKVAETTKLATEPNPSSSHPSPRQARIAPSTPEPQFSNTSFAAFMTPSPVRCSQRPRLRTQGGTDSQEMPTSAMKNPWRSPRTTRRISWAPLPHEQEASQGLDQPATSGRERPASPPPQTPLSEVPISGDARFQRHFTAVANRSSGSKRIRLETQAKAFQDSGAVSEDDSFMADTTAVSEQSKPVHADTDDANDAMGTVADVFDELEDFLETWDVDAELNEARRSGKLKEVTPSRIQVGNPW